MILWGSGSPTYPSPRGEIYNPAENSWRATTQQGAPDGRFGNAVVWTGSAMLVWGGGGQCPGGRCGDGASYNPVSDTWKPLSATGAPSPREAPAAVWTGTEMLIWSGRGGSLGDGAAYDPKADRWRPMAAQGAPIARADALATWTGTEMLVWGGNAPGLNQRGMLTDIRRQDGGAYNPVTNAWRPLSSVDAPSPRTYATAVWTGAEMLVWGGSDATDALLGDGGAYNPLTDTWRPLPLDGAPSPRAGQSAVWTGTQMLVWGGDDSIEEGPLLGLRNDGAAYTPRGSLRQSWKHPRRRAPARGCVATAG